MGAFDDLIPQSQPAAGSFSDLIPQARPKQIPAQELNMGERLVQALPKGLQNWLADPSIAGVDIGKGSAVHGAAMGAADPVVGAAQLATGGQVSAINQAIDAKNADYEAARAGQGRDGFDAARLVGNIASPVNAVVAAAAPIKAVSTVGKALQGARAGAIGGAMAPVLNADQAFIGDKIAQTGIGAAGGALLTPIASKAGEAITRRLNRADPAQLAKQSDQIMIETVNRLRTEGINLDRAQVDALRLQVVNALKEGNVVDPAALFRKADFEALGMKPTLGQVTRDAGQFSREKNLRGVAGVGDDLQTRFDEQSRKLQELITGKSAGALDEASAGESLMASLKGVDDAMNGRVGGAYDKARDHFGRAAPMDANEFSTAANLAIDSEMLNGALPGEARDILNNITAGKIPFNVNSAVLIDKRLSGMQIDLRAQGKKEAALAVGKVRDALNNTSIADNVGEDAKAAFDTARGMARDRFKLHDAVPALKAAADGDLSAQDFVRRYITNGKFEEVQGLAKVLPPEARNEVRRQFGAMIEKAAFGQNMNGDKGVAAESLAKFINQSGMKQKLGAFFTPEEIAGIERIARVSNYIGSFPANATVNTSNSGAAIANVMGRLPGVPAVVGIANSAKNAAQQHLAVKSALAANPGKTAAPMSNEQMKLLASILGGGVAGVAGATGTGIGN